MKQLFLLLFVIAIAVVAVAQMPAQAPPKPQAPAAAQPAQPQTFTSVMERRWSATEKQFVDLADAMPEDKFSFKPSNGLFEDVRTFGEQVRHVAAANWSYAAAMLGEKPPVDTAGESGPDSIKTKAEIMKYLRDSFTYMGRAVKEMNAENAVAPVTTSSGRTINRLWLATQAVGHCGDHYGQLVVYLRMNGIVPPASRR